MFNFINKNLQVNTEKKENTFEDRKETNSLYEELTIKRKALASYLPVGHFIFVNGHKLTVFDEKGEELTPKQEAVLLRQDNKLLNDTVMVGKEVYVVEENSDNITNLLSDNFAKDSMTKLPKTVQNFFTENSVPIDVKKRNAIDKEQKSFKKMLEQSFQVKDYNDFLVRDSENFNSVSLTIDGKTLNSLYSSSESAGNYTLLLMVESIDTGEFRVESKKFTFSELVVFNNISLENTVNFRIRLQLVKHMNEELKLSEITQDLCLALKTPEFEVKNKVMKIKS